MYALKSYSLPPVILFFLSLVQKEKSLYRPKRKLSKQQGPNNLESYPLLIKKKIELIDLQLKLINEEHIQKEKRAAEKHELEMKILNAQLQQYMDQI